LARFKYVYPTAPASPDRNKSRMIMRATSPPVSPVAQDGIIYSGTNTVAWMSSMRQSFTDASKRERQREIDRALNQNGGCKGLIWVDISCPLLQARNDP
jgi:hypothetical protein